jgi:hypothetical protein
MEKSKILVGCYRDWSKKTPSEKAKAHQEEDGADYFEVKAELEALAGHVKRASSPKITITKEQQMVRDLQSAFCNDRYRSWRFSEGKRGR